MLVTKPLPNILAFTRASKAWDVDASGALTEFAVDAIRRGYDPATLQSIGWNLEGASANTVRDPRLELATPGLPPNISAPSSVHPHWSTFAANGLTLQCVGRLVLNGMTFIDVRFSGVATNTFHVVVFDGAASAINDVWTESAYVALIGGSLANVSQVALNPRIGVAPPSTDMTGSLTSTPKRFSCSATENTNGTFYPGLLLVMTNGAPVDLTLRIGGIQAEKLYTASSLILPPVGAPAAAPRAADALVCSGSAFAASYSAGAPQGWMVVEAMIPAFNPIGNMHLGGPTDGTNNNRINLLVGSAGAVSGFNSGPAGVGGGSTGLAGTAVAGVVFRAGLRWNNGTMSACKDGGALVSNTAAHPSGLDRLTLGGPSSIANLNGRLRGVWGGANGGVSDVAFRAACTLGNDPDALLRS